MNLKRIEEIVREAKEDDLIGILADHMKKILAVVDAASSYMKRLKPCTHGDGVYYCGICEIKTALEELEKE